MAAAVGLRELSVRGGGEAPGGAGSFEHGAGCAEEFECLLREALPLDFDEVIPGGGVGADREG